MADSKNPLLANTSSEKQRLLGALLSAMRNQELNSDQLLPAIVVDFDRTNNIATIKPVIKWVDVNNGIHDRHGLTKINVLSLGGGGFNISFPLQPGDLGWVLASDRDISLFKQSLVESQPNTGRLHKFEDGWFIPDVFRKYTIDSADSAAMVIQSTDSATRISISNGVINITAPASVKVDTPQATFTGNVIVQQNLTVQQNATVQQNTNISQQLTVAGATAVNGGFTASGAAPCTLPGNTTIGGTDVSGHGHISTNPGTRTSGGMIS